MSELQEVHENLGRLAESVQGLREAVGVLTQTVRKHTDEVELLNQHHQTLLDKLNALSLIIGSMDNEPEGSLRWRMSLLEQAPVMYGALDLIRMQEGEKILEEALKNLPLSEPVLDDGE